MKKKNHALLTQANQNRAKGYPIYHRSSTGGTARPCGHHGCRAHWTPTVQCHGVRISRRDNTRDICCGPPVPWLSQCFWECPCIKVPYKCGRPGPYQCHPMAADERHHIPARSNPKRCHRRADGLRARIRFEMVSAGHETGCKYRKLRSNGVHRAPQCIQLLQVAFRKGSLQQAGKERYLT